jgi:hypothetical protein
MVSDRPKVIDWQNNFNLALYDLAIGQVEECLGLYDSRSGRLRQRSAEASTDAIEMAGEVENEELRMKN